MSKSERGLSSLKAESTVTMPKVKPCLDHSTNKDRRSIRTNHALQPKATPAAVIYSRVSTKEQTQNLSLETQESVCRAYCERQGLEIDRVFVEQGESAKTAERTELIKLLAYCRAKKDQVQHVVVYRIDRFSRQRYDHAVLVAQLAKNGVTLKSATEPISNDAAGI
jgi:site-specific DNA recombinase